METPISILVSCEQEQDPLIDTLQSLSQQTYQEFDVFLLCSEESFKCISTLNDESRWSLSLCHLGEQKPLTFDLSNMFLKASQSRAVMFCEAGDSFAPSTLEKMFGRLVNNDADIVISEGLSKDFRTKRAVDSELSTKQAISKLDILHLSHNPIFNKMFSRQLLVENGITFGGFQQSSSWHFYMQAVFHSQTIIGCPQRLITREIQQAVFKDSESVGCPTKTIDAFRSVQALSDKILSSYHTTRESLVQADNPRQTYRMLHYQEMLHLSLLKQLTERHIRHTWLINETDFMVAHEAIKEICSELDEENLKKFVQENPDLSEYLSSHNPDSIRSKPVITFAISKTCKSEIAKSHIRYLYSQDFPRFEVIVPTELLPKIEGLMHQNMKVFQQTEELSYSNGALKIASGKYLVFLNEKVFWPNGAAREVCKIADEQKLAVYSLKPMKDSGVYSLPASYMAFKKARCSAQNQSITNQYDLLLSNKLLRVDALRKKKFSFSEDIATDVYRLYHNMPSSKIEKIKLRCMETNKAIISRARPIMRVLARPIYYADRIREGYISSTFVAFGQRAGEKIETVVNNHRRIKNQVLFCTNRASGDLTDNLKSLYDALPCDKIVLSDYTPHTQKYQKKLRKELSRSRVIVTDDYVHEITGVRLRSDQTFLQLWHACGAFKKFGLDCFGMSRAHEYKCSEQYSAVAVSSEKVRSIYAHAFGLSEDKVLALGVPRTDSLFDEKRNLELSRMLKEKHPWLSDKIIILYCPTFRQKMDKVAPWDPSINWEKLSELLGEKYCLAIKRHPLDITEFPENDFKNIGVVDENVNHWLRACDVVITDYSSVVFDAALLNKPMVFYCPDFDSYERDFYLDFPSELPGDTIYNSEDILNAVEAAMTHDVPERYSQFKTKYLEACDGHSIEKIVAFIEQQTKR